MLHLLRCSPLFPYTTLFRSLGGVVRGVFLLGARAGRAADGQRAWVHHVRVRPGPRCQSEAPRGVMTANGLFSIDDLRLYFRTRKGPVQAVDGVSLTLLRGRTVVIVGESGCGKSSLARAILRLLPRNVARYSGSVRLNGLDVMTLPEEQFRQQVRWIRLAWVPQGAMNSLNPVVRIGDQVAEPLLAHRRKIGRAWGRERG